MGAYETKDTPFTFAEIKTEGLDQWQFSGFGSRYHNLDLTGDVVEPGAFDATLKENPEPPLFYQHDPRVVIGYASRLDPAHEKGLHGDFHLFDTAAGSDVYKVLKRRPQTFGLSIGFLTKDADYDNAGVRHLKAVDLLEISVCSMPANKLAVVTDVKGGWEVYERHGQRTAQEGAEHQSLPFDFDPAEMPFDEAWQGIVTVLTKGVEHAKALAARRGADGRGFGPRHTDSLRQALAVLERTQADVKHLLRPEGSPEFVAAKASQAGTPTALQQRKAALWRKLAGHSELMGELEGDHHRIQVSS